jgi:hypothetical protein
MSRFEKIVIVFHSTMSLYGFTRGYRCYDSYNSYENNNFRLTTTKIVNGFTNGYFYAMPFVNIPSFLSLIDRIEIKIRGLDKKKEEYKSSYKEWTGFCYDEV